MNDAESLYDRVMGMSEEIRAAAAEKFAWEVQTNIIGLNDEQQVRDVPESGKYYAVLISAGVDLPTQQESQRGTLDEGKMQAIKDYLRDSYFLWVDHVFERGAHLPNPVSSETAVGSLEQIAGDQRVGMGANDDIAFDPDQRAAEIGSESFGYGVLGNQIFQELDGVRSAMETSSSETITEFRDEFLPRIPAAIEGQLLVVRLLRQVMSANQVAVRTARSDVQRIARNTIAAMEGSGDDSIDAATKLKLVGGVATIVGGVAALPWSGGLSATAVASGIGGLAAIGGGGGMVLAAAEGWGEMSESVPLGADDTEGILDNMNAALTREYELLDNAAELLRDTYLNGTQTHIEGHMNHFRAPRPVQLADAEPGNVRDTVERDLVDRP